MPSPPLSTRQRPLVALGTWMPGSGFTRVLRSVLPPLATGREVHWVGTGYKGEACDVDGVTLHPSNLRGGDVYGGYGTAALAREVGASDVLLLNDLWMVKNCAHPFLDLPEGARVTAYLPLDGLLRDDRLVEPLAFIDTFVAFTEFGRWQLRESLDRLLASGTRQRPVRLKTVPHGVDVAAFSPMSAEAQRAARQRLLSHVSADAFVVLNANRPVERKRIDLTIEGFAAFARTRPDAHLRLHHAHLREDEAAQLHAWIQASGVADQISITAPEAGPLSEADFNALLNACDVGLNTSDGEGWGLVPFEHAATGAAQIVPDNSASGELWRGAAELIPTVRRWTPPYSPLDLESVSASGVADALARVHDDPAHRQRLADAALARATDPAFRWAAIADLWREILSPFHPA